MDTQQVEHPKKKKSLLQPVVLVSILALAAAGWAYMRLNVRHATEDTVRAQDALRLQALTSRLGAAALYAEFGDPEQALSVVSGVFDGIQNEGIRRGRLPEKYAAVLASRDEIVASLARGDARGGERLVELFFTLQLPLDEHLEPELIIPATESGFGLAAPSRVRAAAPGDTAAPAGAADTSRASKPDTAGMTRAGTTGM